MKARHVCAAAGVALAVGTVVFMRSLVATGDHQSVAMAGRLLSAVPVEGTVRLARFSLDFRPDGRVLQGPPMMAMVATAPRNPSLPRGACVVTRALFNQRRAKTPAVGEELVLIGRKGSYCLKIAAVMDWSRPVRGYPNVFVSEATAGDIDEEWREWKAPSVAELAPAFQSEDDRNMSRARPLLLWAAALTALCLMVNSLFLTIEARRKELAILRTVGMTRGGIVGMVVAEAFAIGGGGLLTGILAALAALWVYVKLDVASFPLGMAISPAAIGICVAAVPFVIAMAVAIALRPALSVRPLEAASNRAPRKRHLGMLVSFSCGFGAFVAVEVWGASLMSAFVPSPEWPDAIVSILPAGVSAFDIAKVQGRLHGVKRIHELQPLQVNFSPLEEMTGFKSGRPGGGKSYRNALLLASDYLPPFRFSAGDREDAVKRMAEGDACIITEMMARARALSLGDDIVLDIGHGDTIALKVAGIVDLNWHMVTSRAHVRGLGRMPMNTDGPMFVSFDTLAACDPRPQHYVRMTHLWLDYDEDFLGCHGLLGASRLVEKEIAEVFGTEGNAVRTHARDEIADGTLAHGNDIIGAMAKVPFAFLAVLSLGFIAMLVAVADSRKREFGVLRTVGATRFQLAMELTKEAVKVAVAGLAFGTLFGALAGWLFTYGTRAAMANWGIPPSFAMPFGTIFLGAVGAIGFSIAVAIPTAMSLIRKFRAASVCGLLLVAVALPANAASGEISREEAIKPVKPGELRIEPMFASAGITYGSPKREGVRFEYRKRTGEWRPTYAPYWYDEVNNYRGMAWRLDEDTEYELRVVDGDGKALAGGRFRTWKSEVPIAKTVCLDEHTRFPLVIRDRGTENGWVRYTTKPGVVLRFSPEKTSTAMISVKDAECVVLDDMKIVGGDVRNVIMLRDSRQVRVRNCDISGFGHLGECRYDFAGLYYAGYDAENDKPINGNRCNGIYIGKGMVGAVVERCYIHDPTARSTSWRHAHPAGPNAIMLDSPDHSTSIRYNNLIGADEHRWDDAVAGGSGNFRPNGGFNRTGEIYGNFMIFANDDCIELDGGQQNLACWGNRFEGASVGVSLQGNVVSPSFVFDNLFSGMCEERGRAGSTVKTSGFDHLGQGPFSAVFDNVFWGRGLGINLNVLRMEHHSLELPDAGRVGGIDCIGNVFCGKQQLRFADRNPKGIVRDNRFGVDLPEAGLDRAHPCNPAPFLLDTCALVLSASSLRQTNVVLSVKGARGEEGGGIGFEVAKPSAFDWFEVEPQSGVIREGTALTVRFKQGLKDAPVYRGAFLVRTKDGYARPVSVYVRTGWTQPERCEKPGTTAVYAHPGEGVKDKRGYTAYTFEAPKDARYFFLVYAKADQWPTAMAAVDDEKPQIFTVQTCCQYPVWCVIWPGQPMFSMMPGRLKHYDLKAGKHILRIKGKDGDFTPLAFVMTDRPHDFEPLIDCTEKD